MARLPDDDPDTFTKTVHHFFQHGNEKLCREFSDGAIAHVKKEFLHKFIEDFNTAMKTYNSKMEGMSVYMRTNLDEAEAERLCRTTVLDRQALGQAILDPLLSHCCKKEGFMISPTLSRYMPEPITLDSDSDDTEDSDTSDDDTAVQPGRHLPTRNDLRRGRTLNGGPNSPESQSRSVQRAYEEPPDVYEVPSPEAASDTVVVVRFIPRTPTPRPNDEPSYANSVRGQQRGTDNGTIQSFTVEGEDFIFPYPAVGPGYYIVRCDRAVHMHQFDEDPFRLWGGTNALVKHFARKVPKPTCHRRKDARIYTTDQIITKFGYRVVDDEGADVTAQWVKRSNERVVSNRARESAPKGRQVKGKGKATAGRPVYGPSSRGGFMSRRGPASRRRSRREKVPARSSGSGAGASAAGFEAAGPSERRGPVPVAEMMDIAGLYSDWNQLGEGGDMPPARVESDLNPTE